jgi:hypothetical protein
VVGLPFVRNQREERKRERVKRVKRRERVCVFDRQNSMLFILSGLKSRIIANDAYDSINLKQTKREMKEDERKTKESNCLCVCPSLSLSLSFYLYLTTHLSLSLSLFSPLSLSSALLSSNKAKR